MTAPLQGRRVLVVEDEFLIAVLIQEMLESAGCLVSGPISRLAEALDAAGREDCDAAVLDVNLAGDRIYPVAEILSRRNVPFVFVTGYGQSVLPTEYARRPRLCKPFRMADLLGTVSTLVQARDLSA
ncbi:MAG TPA: response regulator [Stellaceae bacterium]|nr:response regulator [Stellaceae bacterium]